MVIHSGELKSIEFGTMCQKTNWSRQSVPLTFTMLLTYCFNIGSVEEALRAPVPFGMRLVEALNAQADLSYASLRLPKCSPNSESHHCFHDPGFDPPYLYHDQRTGGSIQADLCICVRPLIQLYSHWSLIFSSRDNGLPFSNWIRRVSPRYRIPVNSVLLSIPFTTALALINHGTRVAFNAVLSLATVALMATYVLSISCVTLKRIRKQSLPRARWSLGKFGLPVNFLGAVYAIWSFFWALWPTKNDVSSASFNWAIVLFFGLMGLSLTLYHGGAKRTYHGPVSKVQHWMNEW